MIDRKAVLNKYDSHCAYCGCEITIKSMQVDHMKPKCSGGTDEPSNLMPSCRLCNHYKRSGDVEYLRMLLSEMYRKLHNIYIFRVAEKYGMVVWKDWDGKLYFEKAGR
jgi:5-methylcytosine-specific restriction endonuclease McrA